MGRGSSDNREEDGTTDSWGLTFPYLHLVLAEEISMSNITGPNFPCM